MTSRMSDLAERVRQHWLSQQLAASPPDASSGGVPVEYAEFLSLAGSPDGEDAEGFRFWALSEVRPTSEVLRSAGYDADSEPSPSLVFADYLQESWWYCLWVAGPHRGMVSLVLGQGVDPQPPMGTFADFPEAYLTADGRLFPTASEAR